MSVPARALCVDLAIDTPCAAVAERVKRRHSHVAKRMRSRSSRRFVAVSGSPSYERQTLRRSRFSTNMLTSTSPACRCRSSISFQSFVCAAVYVCDVGPADDADVVCVAVVVVVVLDQASSERCWSCRGRVRRARRVRVGGPGVVSFMLVFFFMRVCLSVCVVSCVS